MVMREGSAWIFAEEAAAAVSATVTVAVVVTVTVAVGLRCRAGRTRSRCVAGYVRATTHEYGNQAGDSRDPGRANFTDALRPALGMDDMRIESRSGGRFPAARLGHALKARMEGFAVVPGSYDYA